MYFSNISNNELQHFHNSTGADFSMSLTEILTSDLFKTEMIIPDKLYRAYPLFYCKEIISNNPNDKILDNKCLILQRQDTETYLSFHTNNEDNILIDETVFNIKDIKDTLSIDEFNAFVYMLRGTAGLTGNLTFEDTNNITGAYGTYLFNNVDEQLQNDYGIIINNTLKNNPLTVKLINSFFIDANYTLTFTVKSFTGANILDDAGYDYITEDTFTVNLVENQEVSLDLTDYSNDSVLLFDFNVSIGFDVPEIVNSNFNVNLTSNTDNLYYNEALILTATLTGDDNVRGYVVNFYEDNVLIDTQTTDANGVAVSNYNPTKTGTNNYSCTVLGLTSNVNVTVNKFNSSLSINVNHDNINYGEDLTITGELLINGIGISGKTVKLYDNNNYIVDLTTSADGIITYTTSNLYAGDNNLKLVYEDNVSTIGSEASTSIIVKLDTNVSIIEYTTSIYAGEDYMITGYLTDELGNRVANKQLKVYYNNNSSYNYRTITTDNNGVFNLTTSFNAYVNKMTVLFNADNYYNTSQAVHYPVINRYTTIFQNITIHESYIEGYLIQQETNTVLSNKTVEVLYDDIYSTIGTTDSNGYFKIQLKNAGQPYIPSVWNELSFEWYNQRTSDYYNNNCTLDITGYIVKKSTTIHNGGIGRDGGSYVYYGRLTDNTVIEGTTEGNGVAGATINWRWVANPNITGTAVTDEDGFFSITSAYNEASFNCIFEGNANYDDSTGTIGGTF